jgi:hypothetical protein
VQLQGIAMDMPTAFLLGGLKVSHKKRRDEPGVFSMRVTREAVD